MRCKACDDLLQPADLKRFSEITKEYLDLCGKCYGTVEPNIDTRSIRAGEEFADDDDDFYQPEPQGNIEHA